MKYFVLTITFLLLILLLVFGFFFYSSYLLWINRRDEVFERLYYFKKQLQEITATNITLTPDLKKSENTIIYDRYLNVIGAFSTGQRKILAYEEINPILINVLLLMEDKRFYSHKGFDVRGIIGALIMDIKTFSLARGGSTITQQLAKILFTNSKKTIRRKVFELFCALEIEKRFTKNEILSLYLNSIYFGHHSYGVESASDFYFQKDVFDLNLYDIALLVGIISNPNRYSPLLHPERSKRKQKIILNNLVAYDIIDAETVLSRFDIYWERFSKIERRPAVSLWSMEENSAPYFVEYVRQELEGTLDSELIRTGGLRIYTTLDIEKNRVAESVLSEGLKLQNLRTKELIGDIKQNIEGALVALDPRNGHILVMVGGSGFTFENQFNRAVYARRQIGSAFKPFVFATAIEEGGFRSDSVFMDEPLEIQTDSGVWKPSNYNDRYYGMVSLEFALKKSLNSVAVQLLQEIGTEKVIEVIGNSLNLDELEARQRFKSYPSVALGVYSFSPLEVATAYSIFPNKGEKVLPISILRVEDGYGYVLIDNERDIKKLKVEFDLDNNLRVLNKDTTETINRMLSEVVKKGGTAYQAFLSSGLALDASGKTGTTDNYTDAWFIGYTNNIIAAVWVGFDDPSYSLGKGMAGGAVAAPIWVYFMKQALWRE